MRIKKTSQYIEGGASLSNEYGTSNENGYTQEYINNLETYSTDEIRIGTWIDGKPLYRKKISGNAPNVTKAGTGVSTNIDLNDNTMTNVMITRAYVTMYGGQIRMLPYIFNSSENIQAYFVLANNQVVIRSTSVDASNNPVVIIIEYTKSTD